MRAFGPTGSAAAPWRAGTDLSGLFTHVVVADREVDGETVSVEAHGDLAAMFYGLENVTSVDLTHLEITDRTTDVSAMFSGMTSVTSIGTGEPTAAGASVPGITLPASMDTSGVTRAAGMFSGMTALRTADFSGLTDAGGFMNADGADLSQMFEGSFAEGASLTLEDFGNGAGADMTRLAAKGQTSAGEIGGGLSEVRMADSASGDAAKLTAAFRGNARLKTAAFTGVGSGAGADLTYMLEACGTEVAKAEAFATGAQTVTWSFADAGVGGGADFSHLATGALTGDVGSGSKIEFLLSDDTEPAVPASVEGMLSGGLHISAVDLRGLAGVAGSAAQWMCGLSGPTSLVQSESAVENAVTLREGFSPRSSAPPLRTCAQAAWTSRTRSRMIRRSRRWRSPRARPMACPQAPPRT